MHIYPTLSQHACTPINLLCGVEALEYLNNNVKANIRTFIIRLNINQQYDTFSKHELPIIVQLTDTLYEYVGMYAVDLLTRLGHHSVMV